MAGNSRKQTVRFRHFHFRNCQKWQATAGNKQLDFDIFILETARNGRQHQEQLDFEIFILETARNGRQQPETKTKKSKLNIYIHNAYNIYYNRLIFIRSLLPTSPTNGN